jgi:hypothetical protein
MVNSAAGESQTCLEVVRLQVGHLVEDLCGVQSCREEIEDVADANPHPPNARTAPALLGIKGNAIKERCHGGRLPFLWLGTSSETA